MAASTADDWMPKASEAVSATSTTTAASTVANGYDSGSATPEEELDYPLEEISEGESSAEEYEDDFEDDFCTEDEAQFFSEVEEMEVGGVLSTVREEQDFTRVMCNYEQDLARAGGSSPSSPAAPCQRPRASSSNAGASPSGAGPPLPERAPSGAIMDINSRAGRVREDLIRKMGADTFHSAFDFLFEARSRCADERSVRRGLEEIVGRDAYKRFCFDVDQLVFAAREVGVAIGNPRAAPRGAEGVPG